MNGRNSSSFFCGKVGSPSSKLSPSVSEGVKFWLEEGEEKVEEVDAQGVTN